MWNSKLDVKFLKTRSALPPVVCLTPVPMESELSACSLTTKADYFQISRWPFSRLFLYCPPYTLNIGEAGYLYLERLMAEMASLFLILA